MFNRVIRLAERVRSTFRSIIRLSRRPSAFRGAEARRIGSMFMRAIRGKRVPHLVG